MPDHKKINPHITKAFIALLFAVPIALVILGRFFDSAFLIQQEDVQALLAYAGPWGPVVFLPLAILAVVITPLNYTVFAISSGYLFNFWLGWLLNIGAEWIGTLINFSIGRYFGKKYLPRLASPETLARYDRIINSRGGLFVIFICYALPLFPSDNTSYIIGFLGRRSRFLLPAMLLGEISTNFTWAYLGSGQSLLQPWFLVFIGCLLTAGALLLYFQRRKKPPTGLIPEIHA